MLRNSLIALSAAAALGVALAPTAEAKTRIGFNIHVGAPVGYVAFGTPRYIYAGGCHYVTVKHKKLKANGRLKVWYSKNLVCY
jgi:hypothetical protein